MFYHNTKYRFALPPGSPETIAGAIVLACAMPEGQLLRRDMRKQPFLQHRMFDPQLYLATLDANTASKSVCNLATWPWFGERGVPQYDSSQHGSIKKWKDIHEQILLSSWSGQPPSTPQQIRAAILAAVHTQINLGCEGVILPSPLTRVFTSGYEIETQWIDHGIEICQEMHVRLPIYASVALSDIVLRGIEPSENPLVHTVTSQLAARSELAGAYFVVEQASEEGYVCTNKDTLVSVLLMVDDLTRGAGKRAIVNYMGTFGPVTVAAGASLFASGYYLSQRRLKLSDFEDKDSRAFPRYLSAKLAGDVGIAADLANAHRVLGEGIFTDTPVARGLHQAIARGLPSSRVPEWEYRQQNITAAAAHYNWAMLGVGNNSLTLSSEAKRAIAHRWLKTAARDADSLRNAGIGRPHSDLVHQQVWLNAFEDWLRLGCLNTQ